ncbi:MAG: undecaprenyl-diphosphate phosphatase [Eubacteriales bacterium]|nr:undecaprenyl-diphosphate phosphatase [Eubacteriales bacterium]
MSIFEAILLGLIQGVTEFLPVSSSGHLTLFGRLFQTDATAMLSFATWLHMGTLISVVLIMYRELLVIIKDLFGKRMIRLVIATIPAVIAAVFFGDWLESLFSGNTLGYEFLITGVILLLTVLLKPKQETDKPIGYQEALFAGIGQAFAIIPAISRSGSSIAALLWSGVNRKKAIRFSFLMSVPAILGSFLLDLVKIFKDDVPPLQGVSPIAVALGVIAAAISGYLAMNFMIRKLNDKGFLISAAYVIALGALILIDQTWIHLVF